MASRRTHHSWLNLLIIMNAVCALISIWNWIRYRREQNKNQPHTKIVHGCNCFLWLQYIMPDTLSIIKKYHIYYGHLKRFTFPWRWIHLISMEYLYQHGIIHRRRNVDMYTVYVRDATNPTILAIYLLKWIHYSVNLLSFVTVFVHCFVRFVCFGVKFKEKKIHLKCSVSN